jgi:predicted lipoprotein with Yx(FWY)xxD motif
MPTAAHRNPRRERGIAWAFGAGPHASEPRHVEIPRASSESTENPMSKPSLSWRPLAVVAAVAILAACGHREVAQSEPPLPSSQPPFAMTQTAIGPVLATSSGMTVYTYEDDGLGRSSCYGECAEYWPPVLATPGSYASGNLTLVPREDGTMQWAVRGMPLYTYVEDHVPGDTNGEGLGDEWYVVR